MLKIKLNKRRELLLRKIGQRLPIGGRQLTLLGRTRGWMDLDLSDVRDLIRNTGIDKHNIMCNKFKREEYERHKKQRNNIANSAESPREASHNLLKTWRILHMKHFPLISCSFWVMLERRREVVVQSRKRNCCSNQRLNIQCNSDHTSQGDGVCALIIFIWPPIPQFSFCYENSIIKWFCRHIQMWSHAILLILENDNSCYILALSIKFHENPFSNQ